MSVDVGPRPMVAERPLPPPIPGESAAAYTVARSVGVFRRAVAAGSVVLGTANARVLIAHTEEIAWRRVDRVALATVQHARPSQPSTRINCLAQYYIHGGSDQDAGEVGLEWGYSFAYGDNGTLRSMYTEDCERKEATARASMIEDSHRLAEESHFTPQEELVVWDALEHAIRYGRTTGHREEAARLAGDMFGLGYEPLPGLPMVAAG